MNISDQVLKEKERRIRNYPHTSNRASEAGHPCERYLVLSRTRWEDKTLHGITTQCIFDGGNMIERMAIRDMQDADLEVIEQQRSFELREYELTGHIDLMVKLNGRSIPVEIKGLQAWDAEGLRTIDDFFKSSKPWIKRYPAQLMLYMKMSEAQQGIFYIINKGTYVPHDVLIDYDEKYIASTLDKLLRVNTHIKNLTLPDQVEDASNCERCPFLFVCLPDIKENVPETISDPELESKIDRWYELKESSSEYNKLNAEIGRAVKGIEQATVGRYLVTGTEVETRERITPAGSYWKKKIVRL